MVKENATFVKAIIFIVTGYFLLVQKTKKVGPIIISYPPGNAFTFSDKLEKKIDLVF